MNGVATPAAELDDEPAELDEELDDELDDELEDEPEELDEELDTPPGRGGTGLQLADAAGGCAGSEAGADHSSTLTRTGSGSGLNTRT